MKRDLRNKCINLKMKYVNLKLFHLALTHIHNRTRSREHTCTRLTITFSIDILAFVSRVYPIRSTRERIVWLVVATTKWFQWEKIKSNENPTMKRAQPKRYL